MIRKLSTEELERISVDEFREATKIPVAIVLDNIRSMNNIGSAFRTSDAFRVEQILLCGITARPPHREIHKTALGATESVAWNYFAEMSEAVAFLQQNDYQIIVVEQTTNSIFLQEFEPNPEQKIAFVFGNEVFGVSETFVQACQTCVEIPQFGTKHSLNISVSMGIILWDYVLKTKSFQIEK